MLHAQMFSSFSLQTPAAAWKAVQCLWHSHRMQYINHQGRWCQELGNSFTNICAIKDQETATEL